MWWRKSRREAQIEAQMIAPDRLLFSSHQETIDLEVSVIFFSMFFAAARVCSLKNGFFF